jgi:queuine/archaeosine tRNA-ribosyltransferase
LLLALLGSSCYEELPSGAFLYLEDAMSTALETRFLHHELTPDEHRRVTAVRAACHDLALALNDLMPPCREQALAMTHLEETMMWAVKAIAMNSEEARRRG